MTDPEKLAAELREYVLSNAADIDAQALMWLRRNAHDLRAALEDSARWRAFVELAMPERHDCVSLRWNQWRGQYELEREYPLGLLGSGPTANAAIDAARSKERTDV